MVRFVIIFISLIIFPLVGLQAQEEEFASQIMGHPQLRRLSLAGGTLTEEKRDELRRRLEQLESPNVHYGKRQKQGRMLLSNLKMMLDLAEDFKLQNVGSGEKLETLVVQVLLMIVSELKDHEITGFHINVLNSSIEMSYGDLNKVVKAGSNARKPVGEVKFNGLIYSQELVDEYNGIQLQIANVLQRGLRLQSSVADAEAEETVATLELSASEDGVYTSEGTPAFRKSHALDYFAANYLQPNGKYAYNRPRAERIAMREYLMNRRSGMSFGSLGRIFGAESAGQVAELVGELDSAEDIDFALETNPAMVDDVLVSIVEMNRLGLGDRVDDVIKASLEGVAAIGEKVPVDQYFSGLARVLTDPVKRNQLASLPVLGSDVIINAVSLDPDGDTRVIVQSVMAEIIEKVGYSGDADDLAERVEGAMGRALAEGFRLPGRVLGLGVQAVGLTAVGVRETGQFLGDNVPVVAEGFSNSFSEGASRVTSGARNLWRQARERMGQGQSPGNLLPAPARTCQSNFL